MKIDLADAVGTAWTVFKRDRDALLAMTGLFLFLPALTMLLLLPPPPQAVGTDAGQAAVEGWVKLSVQWLFGNLPWLAIATLIAQFGALAITAFYLDKSRPSVGQAMARAARLLPGYALLMLAVTLVASIGFLMFVVPGLWVLGRAMLAAPVLVAEGGSPVDAVQRSIGMTRGNGLLMAGLAGIGTFGGQLLASPLLALDDALRAAGAANPVLVTIVDIGAAGLATSVALAMILVRVAIYWRTAGSRSGI